MRAKEEIKARQSSDRLDSFLVTLCQKYDLANPAFLKFMKQILVLFQGNADVERGFSINSECLVENLLTPSLVAQRVVFDEIRA